MMKFDVFQYGETVQRAKMNFLPNISICVFKSSSEAENEGGEVKQVRRRERW